MNTRILMLLDNPFRSDERVRKEIATLTKAGFQVLLIAKVDDKSYQEEIVTNTEVHRWINLDLTRPFHSTYSSALDQLTEQIVNLKFDVLYVHDMYLASLALKTMKRNPNLRVVYDMHEYFLELDFSREIPHWFTRLKGWVVHHYLIMRERELIRRSDVVIVPSLPIEQAIQKRFAPLNTVVLRNVPDWEQTPSITAQENSIRSELSIPANAKVIVHSGNFYMPATKAKNWINRILTELPNYSLLVINDRPIGQELADYARSQPWSDRFHRLGFHDYPQEEIMKACDVGWVHIESRLRSRLMTSPNRLNEYLFAGLPIVSTPQDEAAALYKRFGGIHFYSQHSVDELLRLLQGLDQLSKPDSNAVFEMNWRVESKEWLDRLKALEFN